MPWPPAHRRHRSPCLRCKPPDLTTVPVAVSTPLECRTAYGPGAVKRRSGSRGQPVTTLSWASTLRQLDRLPRLIPHLLRHRGSSTWPTVIRRGHTRMLPAARDSHVGCWRMRTVFAGAAFALRVPRTPRTDRRCPAPRSSPAKHRQPQPTKSSAEITAGSSGAHPCRSELHVLPGPPRDGRDSRSLLGVVRLAQRPVHAAHDATQELVLRRDK